MEEDIPIDIHTGKLVSWLVSRRHVKKNWPEAVQVVREKISNAIQDMPEHPHITKLLSGAYINYFHCLQIIEILQETEKESKNIFGWYTSQRMKDWQEVVKLYEYDNIYLAESSQYLIRYVNYEIPSLKKQIAKCRQVQEECEKGVEDGLKRSTTVKDRYYSSCKNIGIVGDNLKQELFGLLRQLPQKFHEIAEKAKELDGARQFYEDFQHFVTSSDGVYLPLLKFIIGHGDVTLYEWKYGEPPVRIEKSAEVFLYEENATNDGIDFGSLDEEESGTIDFGDDIELETGDIDWGGIDTADITATDAEPLQDGQKSGYDLDAPGSGSLDVARGLACVQEPVGCAVGDFGSFLLQAESRHGCLLEVENEEEVTSAIVVEASGLEGGVAEGEDALTLLHCETTRNQFINEMLELQGFMTQRRVELEAEDNIVSMTLFSNSPKSLQHQNVETMSNYLSLLSEIVNELTHTKLQHLYMINSSPRYVDRLIESLKSHLKEGDRALSSIERLKDKRDEARKQECELSQQLELIVARAKELQENIEKAISLKYKNRIVNLMGGIQHI